MKCMSNLIVFIILLNGIQKFIKHSAYGDSEVIVFDKK